MFRFGLLTATRTIAGVIVLSFVLAQMPAKADDSGGFYDVQFFSLIGLALTEGYLFVGGTVVGVKNSSSAFKGERVSSGWLTQGYIIGALNIAAGSILFAIGDDYGAATVRSIGTIQIGLGLADIGFTIWSHVQENGSKQYITVSPMIIPDKNGNTAVGIGVQIAGW